MVSLLDLLNEDGIRTRRLGKTYRARCPFHNGKTHTSLLIDPGNDVYHCFGCEKHGDAIQWLRDMRGLTFLQACAQLGIDPATRQRDQSSKPMREERFKPREITPPPEVWQKKARTFLDMARENLQKNPVALAWLWGRGLKDDTIKGAGLGWNFTDIYEKRESWGLEPVIGKNGKAKKLWFPRGLVIPLIEKDRVLRLRIRRAKGELRYYIVPGSDTKPMVFNSDLESFVTVESELDGLLISQEAGDLIGTIALGSVTMRPDEDTDRPLKEAGLILNCLDFDRAGAEASWGFWSETYGAKVKRWPVPVGKDPSEAFQKGLNIRAWIEAGLPNKISSPQRERPAETIIRPFPKEWLQRFDETQLERLAIMTVDGRLLDQEAVILLDLGD